MATLGQVYFKKETLQQLVDVLTQKGENGVQLTFSMNDEAKYFNGKNPQNVSMFVSQSKEDKEAGKPKFFVSNGRTVWSNTDGVFVPAYEEPNSSGVSDAVIVDDSESSDLPF